MIFIPVLNKIEDYVLKKLKYSQKEFGSTVPKKSGLRSDWDGDQLGTTV